MLKKLSNKGEIEVFEQIASEAVKYGASIYRKVRVADVIDIQKLPSRSIGTYALQAHFDFVVADTNEKPLFAVEYDGSGHDDKNDHRKDDICLQAGLALFRLNLQSSRIETAQMSFVRYLVNLWFLGMEFSKMQAAGELPYDEPFMMSGFLKPDAKHIFDSEFDLLGPARCKLNRYCKRNGVPGGPLWHLKAAEALFTHETGSFMAYSSFDLGNTKLCGRAYIGLKVPSPGSLNEVPFYRHEIGEFCIALAIEDLIEELALLQEGAGHVLRNPVDVLKEVADLRQAGYVTLLAAYGTDDDFAQAIRGK